MSPLVSLRIVVRFEARVLARWRSSPQERRWLVAESIMVVEESGDSELQRRERAKEVTETAALGRGRRSRGLRLWKVLESR